MGAVIGRAHPSKKGTLSQFPNINGGNDGMPGIGIIPFVGGHVTLEAKAHRALGGHTRSGDMKCSGFAVRIPHQVVALFTRLSGIGMGHLDCSKSQ